MSAPSCATCAWWRRQGPCLGTATRDPSSAADTGTCQLNAPVVVTAAGMTVSVFPATHESRFCGQWKAAPDGGGGGGERVLTFPAPANRIAA